MRRINLGSRRVIGTAVVAAVVAAVVLTVLAVGRASDRARAAKEERAARAVVTGYLSALARGDAGAALQAGAVAPADMTFLTDDVLAEQRAIAPITGIAITSVKVDGDEADVAASYRFGKRAVSAVYDVDRAGDGRWHLVTAAADTYIGKGNIPEPTLFGRPVHDSTVEVFPGPLVIGSASPDLTVQNSLPNDYATEPGPGPDLFPRLYVQLTRPARARVLRAVTASPGVARCLGSRQLAPSGCPQAEYASHAVDGTASWRLTKLAVSDVDVTDLHVRVTCAATFSVRYQAGAGGSERDTVTGDITGTADLTRSPVAFTMIS